MIRTINNQSAKIANYGELNKQVVLSTFERNQHPSWQESTSTFRSANKLVIIVIFTSRQIRRGLKR